VTDDARARLEAQAAAILGRARADATELLRLAQVEADRLRADANRYAAAKTVEADAARERARRQLVQAQEQALAIRAEAQRAAEAVVQSATARARAEADELLREAQRQLARAVDDAREAEARAIAARAAEAEALERLLAMPAPGEVTALSVAAAGDAHVLGGDADDDWLIDLTRDRTGTLEDLVAGAVRAAVHKAVNPIIIRAGRYLVIHDPNHN
jgi:hypothetical protein